MRRMALLAVGVSLALAPMLAHAASPWGSAPSSDTRIDPYKNFKFRLYIEGRAVSGFNEATAADGQDLAEYRAGEAGVISPRKIPGVHKASDVTLKRGVIAGDSDLANWLASVRGGGGGGAGRRNGQIVLTDEQGQPVQRWTLKNCAPSKYSGPSLSGHGGDVAMEELVLSCETITLERP